MENQVSIRDYITKFKKLMAFIYLAAAIIFIIYVFYTNSKSQGKFLKYRFNGVVEKIKYDEKARPFVTIKSATYYLGSNSWNFNRLIHQGDSLEKDSGDITVTLIKHEDGKVIIFDGK